MFNLRKRVAATALLSTGSNPASNRQAASYYSYDINGNVKTLTQENAALAAREASYVTGSTGLKQIKYEYDLVSGKVNKVLYQDGKWDQFYYQYRYDADNRVTEALSSRTNERESAPVGNRSHVPLLPARAAGKSRTWKKQSTGYGNGKNIIYSYIQ